MKRHGHTSWALWVWGKDGGIMSKQLTVSYKLKDVSLVWLIWCFCCLQDAAVHHNPHSVSLTVLIHWDLRKFSVYSWTRSLPMREDVTNVKAFHHWLEHPSDIDGKQAWTKGLSFCRWQLRLHYLEGCSLRSTDKSLIFQLRAVCTYEILSMFMHHHVSTSGTKDMYLTPLLALWLTY